MLCKIGEVGLAACVEDLGLLKGRASWSLVETMLRLPSWTVTVRRLRVCSALQTSAESNCASPSVKCRCSYLRAAVVVLAESRAAVLHLSLIHI